MYWGTKTAFHSNWGQAKELGGQVPPSLYVKGGPVVLLSVGTLGYSLVDTSSKRRLNYLDEYSSRHRFRFRLRFGFAGVEIKKAPFTK